MLYFIQNCPNIKYGFLTVRSAVLAEFVSESERVVLDLTARSKLSGVLREDLRGVTQCTPTTDCTVDCCTNTQEYQTEDRPT